MNPAYGIITGVFFAWAVIATSLVVASKKLIDYLESAVMAWTARYEELEDRHQASSLSELRTHRPVAMEAAAAGPELEYDYDPTGLIRSVRAAADDDE